MADAIARNLTLADMERLYLLGVLHAEGGNNARAAERLGIDRKTLYRKLECYGMGPDATEGADDP